MNDGDGSPDLRSLMDGAQATHDLYLAYIGAGFDPHDALQIVIAMITATITAA